MSRSTPDDLGKRFVAELRSISEVWWEVGLAEDCVQRYKEREDRKGQTETDRETDRISMVDRDTDT